jgi:hypothetical protein
VRVVIAHHVADHSGALDVPTVGAEAGVVHRVEDLAVDGLEAVANVRQRTTDDDAHRVIEVRALHLDLETDRFDPLADRAADLVGGLVARGLGSIRHWLALTDRKTRH